MLHADKLADLILGQSLTACKESGPEFSKFLLELLDESTLSWIKEYSPEQGEPVSITPLLTKEFPKPQKEEVASGAVAVNHLPFSDLMLMTRGSQLKLAARKDKEEFLSSELATSPRPALVDIEDKVSLFFTPEHLKDILTFLRWDFLKAPEVARFLKAIDETYDGSKMTVCFIDALIALKSCLRVAVGQYQEVESKGCKLEAKELIFSEEKEDHKDTTEPILSLIEA
mmetsp:Transcript_19576/g.30117  ORF Transcript_19576/g.30117 Transcript_19576/m.30117 type:complete len:228 (+) Transcript_19576:974-1657(+)